MPRHLAATIPWAVHEHGVDFCHQRQRLLRFRHRRVVIGRPADRQQARSDEHTSELQSLMRISYAVFSMKKNHQHTSPTTSRRQSTHVISTGTKTKFQ